MKKPTKLEYFKGKPRALDNTKSEFELERVAASASYRPSVYHCPDKDGKIRFRTKPASRCPDDWTVRDATVAVRTAIEVGNVSRQWTRDGFPRHVWHYAGGMWYEACTSDAADGVYHGYPVEARSLPSGLQQ